jgi:hypothetical protein
VMGQFGVEEVLKQFLKEDRAKAISPTWDGDRYAVFEDSKNKNLKLVWIVALETDDDAARFFGQYSEALELKYSERTKLFRRPNFFQFDTPAGGVFLRCLGRQCLTVEGASRQTFEAINRAMDWPASPGPAEEPSPSMAQIPETAVLASR